MKTKPFAILLLLIFSILLFASCDYIENTFGNGMPDEEQNIHTHDYSVRSTAAIYQKSQATCTEASVYYFSCTCGEKGSETFRDGEALGHVWMRENCENPLYCAVCHIKDDKPAGHIWQTSDDGKIKTCTSCGTVLNLDEHTHTWNEATCTTPKTCSVCGDTEGEAKGHNWDAATCTAPKTCSVCGDTEGEAKGHNWDAATCTVPKTCSVCGATEGEAIGHNWDAATCTKPKTCSVCGVTEGEAPGHAWIDANCQSAKKCSVCGLTEGGLGNHNFVNSSCTICGYIEKTLYTVKVVTAGGMPLEGVMVYVHDGDEYSICAIPVETDEKGIATFELKTFDGYSIMLEEVPAGYEVKEGLTKDDRYLITSDETVITLTSAPIKTGGFASSYELGDVMYDFTLTDVDGNSYTLSEVLKSKDMVMLNFWYINCTFCCKEFPYINSAYNKYKDEIEIFAINDYDSAKDIKDFRDRFTSPLDMPLIEHTSGSGGLDLSKFPSHGYPTTVIIDRYGVVCMIEVGAITNEETWNDLFEYFTQEDYKQKLIRN